MDSFDIQQGDIVWIPSNQLADGDRRHNRPSLILSKDLRFSEQNRYIITFLTSRFREKSIPIAFKDLSSGSIGDYDPSYVNPISAHIIPYSPEWQKTGTLQKNKIKEILSEFNKTRDIDKQIHYQTRSKPSGSLVFERPQKKS